MAVPYIFANTPGGSSIPLAELDANFAAVSQIETASTIAAGPNSIRNIAVDASFNVFVEGYSSNGDGGGGQFFPSPVQAPGYYVDNGGTIIIPSVGVTDGSVAWLRTYGDQINVLWWGPAKDGSVDASFAFRRALDIVPKNGCVLAPEGTYLISSTVYLPQRLTSGGDFLAGYSMVSTGATIVGTGNNTIFESGTGQLSTGGATNWGLPPESAASVHCNLKISGFYFRQVGIALKLYNCIQACAVKECVFYETVTALWALRCFYMNVVNNTAWSSSTYSTSSSVLFLLDNNVNVMNITGNSASFTLSSVANRGIGFQLSNGVAGLLFSNNAAEACSIGVSISGEVTGVGIIGNYFEADNIAISLGSSGKTGLTIDDNWFFANKQNIVSAGGWIQGKIGNGNRYRSTTGYSASWSGGIVTMNISGVGTFAAGNTVYIANSANTAYNGTYAITSATSTQIRYALASNPGAFTGTCDVHGTEIQLAVSDFPVLEMPAQYISEANIQAGNWYIYPAWWSLQPGVVLKPQNAIFNQAVGYGAMVALANDQILANNVVPYNFYGNINDNHFGYAPYAIITNNASTTGQIIVDTKINYVIYNAGILFDFFIIEVSVDAYPLAGYIYGNGTVFRYDSKLTRTITTSNNGGYFRITIGGIPTTSTTVITGKARIV